MKYHVQFEKNEQEYRRSVFSNFNKKKTKRELRKEIKETQHAYENLYVTENEDKSAGGTNIIKIRLEP